MRLDWAILAKAAFAAGGPPSDLAAGLNTVAVVAAEDLPPGTPLAEGAISSPVAIALVMGLLAPRAEAGRQQTIEVTVTDTDGTERLHLQPITIVAPPSPPDLPIGMDIPLVAVVEMNFYPGRFDTHTVNIFVSGSVVKQIPLIVRRQPL